MHWMLFGAVALLLFGGKGKISDIMGDVAKGIKSFKKGMNEDDTPAPQPVVTPATRVVEAHAPVATESRENQKVG
jgi:sec-independent protein translocase protein TatA